MQIFLNRHQINILFFLLIIVCVLCHYNEITMIPFFYFCISFKRIWRLKSNHMITKSENSIIFFTAQCCFVFFNHIFTVSFILYYTSINMVRVVFYITIKDHS